VIRPFLLAAVLALSLPGCCVIAHAVCPCDPGKVTETTSIRETPDAAVDFLVSAFRDRRVADIYSTFHPDFVRENGNFSQEEFHLAYEKFEKDFAQDAANMAVADRSEVVYDPTHTIAAIRLANDKVGAEFPIAFKDMPKIRIVTTDPFVGEIQGAIDIGSAIVLDHGKLSLPTNFDLTSIENVQRETVAGLTAADISRIEISHDWRVWRINPSRAKNIHFLDRLKEYTRK
jgi:hypothetical protein